MGNKAPECGGFKLGCGGFVHNNSASLLWRIIDFKIGRHSIPLPLLGATLMP
jgi:hypothetical protein